MLATWLNAELFITDFRPVPLTESIKCGNHILDKDMKVIRTLQPLGCPGVRDDDFIVSLCLETLLDGQSVLIFCPAKQWCETLAASIAKELAIIRDKKVAILGGRILGPPKLEELEMVAGQLYRSAAGLDGVLSRTLSSGVAFHHAGLTVDERDIIEMAFRRCIVRVLVATTTLSSGVNLPSRRVIIRSCMAGGAPVDIMSYRQMAGRAGRKGVDTSGESFLLCKPNEKAVAARVVNSGLPPLRSCLARPGASLSSSLKRAVLEVISTGVAQSQTAVFKYLESTLLAAECVANGETTNSVNNLLEECINYLLSKKFAQLDDGGGRIVPTQLGLATLSAAMGPDEALSMLTDLERARQSLCLDSELHLVYLVTPVAPHWPDLDWSRFALIWDQLPMELRRVAGLVGVKEQFIARAAAGRAPSDPRQLRIYVRFVTSLVLLDLIEETPLMKVASKFQCTKGFVQSLQQQAATFAGMTASFIRELGWRHFDSLLASFQSRIAFGVQPELLDLLQVPLMTAAVARHLYKNGIKSVETLATQEINKVETVLLRFKPFEMNSQAENENENDVYVASEIPLNDRPSVTPGQAAQLFTELAKQTFETVHGDRVKLVTKENVNASKDETKENQNRSMVTRSGKRKSPLSSHESSPMSPNASSTADKSRKKRKASSVISPNLAVGQSTLDMLQSSINFTPVYHGVSLSQPTPGSNLPNRKSRISNSQRHNESLLGDASLLQAFERCEIDEGPSSVAKESVPKFSSTPANRNDEISCSISDSLVAQIAAATDESCMQSPDSLAVPVPTTPLQLPTQSKSINAVSPNFEDSSDLNIVQVASDAILFQSFIKEWRKQPTFALSVACCKMRSDSSMGALDLNVELEGDQRIVGLAISYGGPADVYYISLRPTRAQLEQHCGGCEDQSLLDASADDSLVAIVADDDNLPLHVRLEAVRSVLSNSKALMEAFDAKRQLRLLHQIGISFSAPLMDPKLAFWVLDPSDTSASFHALVLGLPFAT